MEKRRGVESGGLVALAGVVAFLVISLANWRDVQRIDRVLGERLSKLTASPAFKRAPDPNKVYTIKTDGSPSRGRRGRLSRSPSSPTFSDRSARGSVRPSSRSRRSTATRSGSSGSTFRSRCTRTRAWRTWRPMAANDRASSGSSTTSSSATRSKMSRTTSRYAQELGLDVERFEKDIDGPEVQEADRGRRGRGRGPGRDRDAGLLRERQVPGGAKPFEEFAKAINAELARLNVPAPPGPPAS